MHIDSNSGLPALSTLSYSYEQVDMERLSMLLTHLVSTGATTVPNLQLDDLEHMNPIFNKLGMPGVMFSESCLLQDILHIDSVRCHSHGPDKTASMSQP